MPDSSDPGSPGHDPASSPASEVSSSVSLDSLLAVAKALHRDEQDYTAAREILVPALELAKELGDIPSEARALTWLGLGYWRTGDYGRAGRLGQEALDLKVANDLTDQLHTSYNALGLLAYYQNQFGGAFEQFNEAVKWGRRAGKRGEVATTLNNLALVQTEWGDFEAARNGFLAMRDTMMAMGDESGNEHLSETRRLYSLSAALTNLGMLENRIGNPSAAARWLEQAIDVSRDGSPAGQGLALGHLAMAYAALGEQSRAFEALDDALAIVRPLGLAREVASNLEVLAEQFREAGDFRRALDLYAEARDINEELNLTVETGTDLRGEAQILLSTIATTSTHVALSNCVSSLLARIPISKIGTSIPIRSLLPRVRSAHCPWLPGPS